MKIAVINQPLANRGDESAHKALLRAMSKALPEDKIVVVSLCVDSELVDEIKVSEKNVSYIVIPKKRLFVRFEQLGFVLGCFLFSYFHPSLRRFRKLLKNYDAVVCAPGGMCMGGFTNWDHIWQLDVARRLKKPIFYWGRSIGPFSEENFKKRLFKKCSIRLLHYFSYISLRDSVSMKIADELGIKAVSVVDSAFLSCPDATVPEKILREIDGNKYVVFVPNSLTWHPRYKNIPQEKIDSFFLEIFKLIEKEYPAHKMVMLPQTYKSCIDDYSYFEKLKAKYGSKNVIAVDENQSSDVQQAIIKGAELVIGARYHSIVFAINNGTPFISLSYEHKMKGLLEMLGMTSRMVEIQDIFDGEEKLCEKAVQKVDALLSENALRPSPEQARKIVQRGFDRFVGEIKAKE